MQTVKPVAEYYPGKPMTKQLRFFVYRLLDRHRNMVYQSRSFYVDPVTPIEASYRLRQARQAATKAWKRYQYPQRGNIADAYIVGITESGDVFDYYDVPKPKGTDIVGIGKESSAAYLLDSAMEQGKEARGIAIADTLSELLE